MNSIKLTLALLLSTLIWACSSEQDYPIAVQDQEKYSALEERLVSFYSAVTEQSRGEAQIDVISVYTQNYCIEEDTVIEVNADTQSRGNEDTQFEIKTVKFQLNENMGFAVLSDTPKIDQVFFFTEEGCIEDSCYNIGLKDLIEELPMTAASILLNGLPEIDEPQSRSITVIKSPLCHLKWGQGYPYNRNAKACDCSLHSQMYYNERVPVGCQTTAVAMALATFGPYEGKSYKTRYLDFSNFPDGKFGLSESQIAVIGHFFHEVAMGSQIKFDCSGSKGTLKNSYYYLEELGYNCEFTEGSLDVSKLILELVAGYPHIMRGSNSNGDGHAWIIDGLRIVDGAYQFHINWGWDGSSNCYTLGYNYTSESDSFPKNNRHIYTYSKNS